MTLLTIIGMGATALLLVTGWFWLRWALPLLPTEDPGVKAAAYAVARMLTLMAIITLAVFLAMATYFTVTGFTPMLSLALQIIGWATAFFIVVALFGMAYDVIRRIRVLQTIR